MSLPEDFSALTGLVVDLPGDMDTVDIAWDIEAPDLALAPRQLRVTASGYDKNSSQLVQLTSNSLPVRVVAAANLNLSLDVIKLGGVDNDTLSQGQIFKLQALVNNEGTAGVTGPGSLSLEDLTEEGLLLRLDTLNVNSDTLNFTIGSPLVWYLQVLNIPEAQQAQKALVEIRADALRTENASATSTIWSRSELHEIFLWAEKLASGSTSATVHFSDIPSDMNTNETAKVNSMSVTQPLYLQNAAQIEIDSVKVPDVLSTGQTFTFSVTADLTENLSNPIATLDGPAAFNIAPRSLLLDEQNTARWNITVPPNYSGAAAETLIVLVSGEDANSGYKISASRPDTSFVRIQLRPVLTMSSQILSPPSAVSAKTVSRGQTIEIEVWPGLAPEASPLEYAAITGTGTILLEDDLFTVEGFEPIAGESYEKTFASLDQRFRFRMRASRDDKTVGLKFRFNQRPEDVNSGTDVDVDVNQSQISIPITVRQKEIRVTLSGDIGTPDIFTRGTTGAVLFAFKISNENFEDSLYVNGLSLKFTSGRDTLSFSSDALKNMLDSVFVVDEKPVECKDHTPGDRE